MTFGCLVVGYEFRLGLKVLETALVIWLFFYNVSKSRSVLRSLYYMGVSITRYVIDSDLLLLFQMRVAKLAIVVGIVIIRR